MENIILQITHILEDFKDKFFAYSEAELKWKNNKNQWSKKEILGHLIDSAQNNIRRIVMAHYKENENIVYDQIIWVQAADYQEYNTCDLVNLFILLNKHFCVLLNKLPKEKYNTLANMGSLEPKLVTIDFVASDYLCHFIHHINQIFDDNYSQKFGEY